ncbi:MAG: tryptophan-rich sensory protein [Spirochaetia bacterium]|nr:tryptophan-rich sensory protein [Spirochaetia bacterium]
MKDKGTYTLIALLNTITLIMTITVNALANILPINGQQTGTISDNIPNLFAPIGSTFIIWGVIYISLFLSVIYQLIILGNKEKRDRLAVFGPYFIYANIFNGVWIFAWHYLQILPSLIIMLLLLVSLIILYVRITKVELDLSYNMLIKFPISIYLGWVTIATVANVTALLVTINWNGFGLSPMWWTIIVIAVAAIINSLVSISKQDIWFAIVGVWSLYGVWQKRGLELNEVNTTIQYAALIAIAFIFISIIITLILKAKKVMRESN